MDFLKGMAGKIMTGLVGLGVIIAGISWWQMEPATRDQVWSFVGKGLIWLGFVIFLPWVCCLGITRVAKMDSNLAGAILVLGLTLADGILLTWLGWGGNWGTLGWVGAGVSVLIAGAYNLLSADWIAEKMG